VWLYATTWPTHPHLNQACLTGYGRTLSDTEQQALPRSNTSLSGL
jgi:hypothetical protein